MSRENLNIPHVPGFAERLGQGSAAREAEAQSLASQLVEEGIVVVNPSSPSLLGRIGGAIENYFGELGRGLKNTFDTLIPPKARPYIALPSAGLLALISTVACGEVASGRGGAESPPAITPTHIVEPTKTPTREATPTPKPENPIPNYSSCSGELLDPKTGGKVGLMVITSLPPSPETRNVGAIAFFYSFRDVQRDQINEQQYVVYIKNVNSNNVQGNRGFWDVTATVDSTTKQVTGNIGGPPGDYDFRGQCNGSGKTVFTDALGTIINRQRYNGNGNQQKIDQDVQKILKEFDSFGMNWQNWPS